MTKEEIEDYLYFFWAPLLEANAVSNEEMPALEKMVALTFSQVSVYIEAPAYASHASTREYTDTVKNAVSELAGKIFTSIPGRTPEDSYWLNISVSELLPEINFTDKGLQPEPSFGPYKTSEEKFFVLNFYHLANQLQLQLPTTAEVSAILSTRKPVAIPDGAVTGIEIEDCALWLSAIHFDASAADAAFYTCVRLKHCRVSFDAGYTKTGNKIAAGLFDHFAGFVITCIPADEIPANISDTIAANNTVNYPGKFVFSFKHRAGLPQPPKIRLTHAEAFSATLFGSAVNTLAADNLNGNWHADKKMLSFLLQTEQSVFEATQNTSPVFDLKGKGKIIDAAWYFPVISTNHPLGVARLGMASESGCFGFDVRDQFSLSWRGLENGPVKLQSFFLCTSPETLTIRYTSIASVLAKQQLKLWAADNNPKARSAINLTYNNAGAGSFISHRRSNELLITNAAVDVAIDKPLLSNGGSVFYKATAGFILFNDEGEITAAVAGGKMDPSVAFENNAFRSLSSFALSNALIVVRPVAVFSAAGKLNASGFISNGRCLIHFPVVNIEHTLPDPYITSLFNDQPVRDDNANQINSLRATIKWEEGNSARLVFDLNDEQGNAFVPKTTKTDAQLADILLRLPLPHPAEPQVDALLKNASAASPQGGKDVVADASPYVSYQSSYHSKTNTTGAYAMLHILPGDVSLVDVSGRASQMGISFYRKLIISQGVLVDKRENAERAVFDNTGYTQSHTFKIENNELVSSGRFVRAFALPHVQWEPVYFEEPDTKLLVEGSYFPTHGVPTRMASANKEDVALAPIPVTKFIVDGYLDERNKYAVAAHFALPFGMNAIALFHPKVEPINQPPAEDPATGRTTVLTDPYSYSILDFNQPRFNFKKALLSGAIQIKALSEGYPEINRDEHKLPDPAFHGAVVQVPGRFIMPNAPSAPIDQDSILDSPITKQFNKVMWGDYTLQDNQFKFTRSPNAKVPLRRIDFSGFGASVFSDWLYKNANAGSVSQVQFRILIGRTAHEVVQIKSVIIPWFIPVVRAIIIERKNHGNVIRTDTGWVATGPGEFHAGYTFHPGVVKGAYNVTSIKDTTVSLQQTIDKKDTNGNPVKDEHGKRVPVTVDMAGVYFDAELKIENVSNNFRKAENNYKRVPSKKQFGYILLGNPDDGQTLDHYYTNDDLQAFLSRPDVGSLGGPVDCVMNIAGSDQMMHLTRVDVTAAVAAKASVAAAHGTLQLPKGGSWSVVKKTATGATLPLTNDETVPLIRNGILNFDFAGNPAAVAFNGSPHVLGNPLNIDNYKAGSAAVADTEYALLQSTGTQKLLFPRPSFNSKNDADINNDGITNGEKKIFTTDPLLADPYSLLKSNAIFPSGSDALTLGNKKDVVKFLDITKDVNALSFPNEVANELKDFVPLECIPAAGVSRKLYLVQEDGFKIFIDYGIVKPPGKPTTGKQKFTAALNAIADDNSRWQMINTDVAIVVELGNFKPLLTVTGNFTAQPGAKPTFDKAEIKWGEDPNLQKIVQVLSILYMLSNNGETKDIIKDGFSFAMGNSPDSWSYKCTIEEKIPVIQVPNNNQLAQLPAPAPLIVQAGLDLGVFFNLSLSTDPNNLIKAGAGVVLGFEATIQVLLITLEAITAYGVGTAKVDVFIELPEAKPTFKFTMGFGATVAVQLPMVGYVSLTRVISLGASIDNGSEMTVGQLLKGVITVGGGLASVGVQVEASGTVSNKGDDAPKPTKWTATVRGVFTLDVTVAFVFSWEFSKPFEHEVDLPNPF